MKYRIDAARNCPATLAGALISRKSSATPTTKITPAASSTPNISWLDVITARRVGTKSATTSATQSPTSIAAPPP